MKIVQLTDTIGVSEQITAEDLPSIAAAGYKVVVNNRPDGEVAEQPAGRDIQAAAQAAGLAYYHLPVTAVDFPGPDVATMKALFDDSSRPVLAFCRTGTRCTNLWVTTREAQDSEAAREHAAALGYDLSMSTPR